MEVFLIFLMLSTCAESTNLIDQFISTFTDPQLTTSLKCRQQLLEYSSNLEVDTNSWAFQMLDATSKLPSGLLSLNYVEMGNFQQCIGIKNESSTSGTILGKYCLGSVNFTKPDGNETIEAQLLSLTATSLGDLAVVAQSQRMHGPVWAICIPDGCTDQDADIIGSTLFTRLMGQDLGIKFPEILCQTIHQVHRKLSTEAVVTICVLLLLSLVALLSTLYDLYCTYVRKPNREVFTAFSAYTNGKHMFKVTKAAPDQLPCLNGLRFISILWVVFCHQYSVTITGPIANTRNVIDWAESLYSMFVISGTLAVDTFLTIGGVLVSYRFMKGRYKDAQFNIFYYYIHRYIRLTAPFAVVILVSSTLLVYLGSGPQWPFVNLFFQQNCVYFWWSALLYVQNYVNVGYMCVGQTWYLDIDMQLYLVSPIVLFALWKWPKVILPVLGLATLGFMGASFYAAHVNQLTAILSNLYGNPTDFSNKYYLLTHTRAASWIMGLILGYYLAKIKDNEMTFSLNRTVILTLWVLCFTILLTCVLGGHLTLRSKEYDRLGNSVHIALVRPAWSIGICWVILACTTSNGGVIQWVLSLPVFQVLNRFTYGIYLTHVTMLYLFMFNKKTSDYFSEFNMAYQFWGTFCLSTGLSVLLVLIVEAPVLRFEKIFFGKVPKTRDLVDKSTERGIDNVTFEK